MDAVFFYQVRHFKDRDCHGYQEGFNFFAPRNQASIQITEYSNGFVP